MTDLPTPTNGGIVIVAVVVALIVWAAVTMARAPYMCETCGHLEDATDALDRHELTMHADALCVCGHIRGRHAHGCVARGCGCPTFTAAITERTPS